MLNRIVKKKNLVGKTFGRLVVIAEAPNRNGVMWLCRCECGNEKIVSANSLRQKNTQSCGCLLKIVCQTRKRPEACNNFGIPIFSRKAKDISGQRFGRLTAQSVAKRSRGGLEWLCDCDCGKQIVVRAVMLRFGAVNSCGCSRRKLPPQDAQINRAFRAFLVNAKSRNLPVELSKNKWKELVCQPCHYCGKMASNTWNPRNRCYGTPFVCNGIDRLDSNCGYIVTNCVACCKTCNKSKGIMSVEEFVSMAHKISNFHTQKAHHA